MAEKVRIVGNKRKGKQIRELKKIKENHVAHLPHHGKKGQINRKTFNSLTANHRTFGLKKSQLFSQK